jgi:hypothetical protein
MRSSVGIVWKDTDCFRKAVLGFVRDRVYCEYAPGTTDYREFWDEELRRCREGYMVKKRKITGNHYFYLNYCRILRVTGGKGRARRKQMFFPDFWDMDYEYFWWVEIARFGVLGELSQCRELLTEKEKADVDSGKLDDDKLLKLKEDVVYNRLGLRLRTHPDWLDGGHHMIVAKARRKGFSYKNTAMMVNIYNSIRNSQCVFGVAEKDYADQGMGMVNEYLGFLNEHTAWGKRREFQNTKDHKRASYKKVDNGMVMESGYMSEIICSSFMNNTEATRGKSPYLMLYEEAGTFPALLDVWAAAIPSMEDGDFVTGQSIVFGTGGKMSSKKGEFSKMFYNPMFYNIMPFENIWDDGQRGNWCGFFFPAHWNYVGMMDDKGNSDFDGAMQRIIETRRQKIESAVNAEEYQKYVIEYPICPQESFMSEESKVFNIPKLHEQLRRVVTEGLQQKKGICVSLRYANEGKSVKAMPILNGEANPITEYDISNRSDLTGCPIIYEYPIEDPPKGLYRIGYDPYRQDDSTARDKSLAAIIVYKGSMAEDRTRNIVVAEYVGRPETCDDCDEMALKLAILYNAEVMYENDVRHTETYFTRRHKLQYLALQPINTVSSVVKNPNRSRKYGCSLGSKQMKDAGEKYLKKWLTDVIGYDEQGNDVTTVDRIYSVGLLQELIRYYRDGNFDRVCAMFQIMFQLQDEELGKEYSRKEVTKKTMSMELANLSLFRRGSSF